MHVENCYWTLSLVSTIIVQIVVVAYIMFILDAIIIAVLLCCDLTYEMCGTFILHLNKMLRFLANVNLIKAEVELGVTHCVCFANRDNLLKIYQ